MDFIEGLPKYQGKDVIMVVVDRFTKYSHFIPLSHPYNVLSVVGDFIDQIVRLHGPAKLIISDRDRIFTGHLWKGIFSALNWNYDTLLLITLTLMVKLRGPVSVWRHI